MRGPTDVSAASSTGLRLTCGRGAGPPGLHPSHPIGAHRGIVAACRALHEVGIRLRRDPDAPGPRPPLVLILKSDAGSDQGLAARLLAHRHAHHSVCIVSQFCLQHQLHLAVERALARGGHWPVLAMLTHCWRASGNGAKFQKAFAQIAGPVAAQQLASSPPPVPIKGRWGSAAASEARILRCDRAELLAVPRP